MTIKSMIVSSDLLCYVKDGGWEMSLNFKASLNKPLFPTGAHIDTTALPFPFKSKNTVLSEKTCLSSLAILCSNPVSVRMHLFFSKQNVSIKCITHKFFIDVLNQTRLYMQLYIFYPIHDSNTVMFLASQIASRQVMTGICAMSYSW